MFSDNLSIGCLGYMTHLDIVEDTIFRLKDSDRCLFCISKQVNNTGSKYSDLVNTRYNKN